MIDWSRIESFDWDDGNGRKSVDRHRVEQIEAEQIFTNRPLVILPGVKHSEDEARYHALGHADSGLYLQVSFTLREHGTRVGVISARDMSRRERAYYASKKA